MKIFSLLPIAIIAVTLLVATNHLKLSAPSQRDVTQQVRAQTKKQVGSSAKKVRCPRPEVKGLGNISMRCRATVQGKRVIVPVRWRPLGGFSVGRPQIL